MFLERGIGVPACSWCHQGFDPPPRSLLYFLQGNSVQLSSLKLPQFFFLVLLCFYLLSGRTFELRRQDSKASRWVIAQQILVLLFVNGKVLSICSCGNHSIMMFFSFKRSSMFVYRTREVFTVTACYELEISGVSDRDIVLPVWADSSRLYNGQDCGSNIPPSVHRQNRACRSRTTWIWPRGGLLQTTARCFLEETRSYSG